MDITHNDTQRQPHRTDITTPNISTHKHHTIYAHKQHYLYITKPNTHTQTPSPYNKNKHLHHATTKYKQTPHQATQTPSTHNKAKHGNTITTPRQTNTTPH